MKKSPKLPRLLSLLIVLAAAACFIASATDQPVAAVAANGKIAFTSDNVIYTTTSFDEHDLAWQPLGSTPTPTATLSPTPIPSPSPTFTIMGTVTDTNGQGIADVTMVLLGDVTGTQVAFTNQSGNYVLTYPGGVNHSLRITPSKSGYIFDPLGLIFISSSSFSENKIVNFVGTQNPVVSVQMPTLLTQENSQRALALDSVMWVSEPFGVANINNLSADQHTRISLFAVNMEQSSLIGAQAEDSLGQIFPLIIEHICAVPNVPWLKQVVVR